MGGGDCEPDGPRRHAHRLGAKESGGYRGQMAVLVKPNGPLGAIYMAAIKPFRHLLGYPALMRWIEHEWQACA